MEPLNSAGRNDHIDANLASAFQKDIIVFIVVIGFDLVVLVNGLATQAVYLSRHQATAWLCGSVYGNEPSHTREMAGVSATGK